MVLFGVLLYFCLEFTKEQFNLSKYPGLSYCVTALQWPAQRHRIMWPSYWSHRDPMMLLSVSSVKKWSVSSQWFIWVLRTSSCRKSSERHSLTKAWCLNICKCEKHEESLWRMSSSCLKIVFHLRAPSLLWSLVDTQIRPTLWAWLRSDKARLMSIKRLIFNTFHSLVIFSVFQFLLSFYIKTNLLRSECDEFNTGQICRAGSVMWCSQ